MIDQEGKIKCPDCNGEGVSPYYTYTLLKCCDKCKGNGIIYWINEICGKPDPFGPFLESADRKATQLNIERLTELLRNECYKIGIEIEFRQNPRTYYSNEMNIYGNRSGYYKERR
jgi:hypothetical protein